jgi:hypothetical protein
MAIGLMWRLPLVVALLSVVATRVWCSFYYLPASGGRVSGRCLGAVQSALFRR